jgi:SAM-dependent methyltransferase
MAFGSELTLYGGNPLSRFLGSIFGVSDIHSHIRIRPLVRHLPAMLPKGRPTILECGCGAGLNLFEIAKITEGIIAEGYDLDDKAIGLGNSVRQDHFPHTAITLHCADVTRLEPRGRAYDCVLLMDVLEHVVDDAALASWVIEATKEGGLICVSVPTHRYRPVFGRDFHAEIGHVREGYTAAELGVLFSNVELVSLWYNTGLLAQLGCRIYYQYLRKIRSRIMRALLSFSCRALFSWADFPNGAKLSCSVFAIYRKSKRPETAPL